jgi:hypothetical protein
VALNGLLVNYFIAVPKLFNILPCVFKEFDYYKLFVLLLFIFTGVLGACIFNYYFNDYEIFVLMSRSLKFIVEDY